MKKLYLPKQAVKFKYGNKPTEAVINGQQYQFPCRLEYRWAQYLEFLRVAGEIKGWFYEHQTFRFDTEVKPTEYTPDFLVRQNDNTHEYHECKGLLQGYDLKKLKRMFDERPYIKITMVFWTPPKPKLSTQKRHKLELYCSRVIYNARDILKQLPIDMD